MTLPLTLAALALLLWLGLAAEVMRGNRRLRRLVCLPPDLPADLAAWPRVTIVIAARNEGRTIGAALPTVLHLDYPDLELIAVNDRSEDDTGAVLDKIATTDPRLRVDHIKALPAGWLGKNHALHHGAARATGEWILFTDADIHFRPDALRRAIAAATRDRLDLVAAVPQLHERGHLLGICVTTFSLLFAIFLRPWRIPNPASRCHGGVGAFNLVRAAAYRRLGGHEPLRLRPDDDIKLGKLFKDAGTRCELMLGAGAVAVAWYDSVGGLIHGLTKNAYAGVDYRAWLVLGAVGVHALGVFWPLAALVLVSGPAWWLYLGAVLVMGALAIDNGRFDGARWWYGLFFPVGIAVMDYILLRSMVVTHATGGITWRGTHYPLAALKANRL